MPGILRWRRCMPRGRAPRATEPASAPGGRARAVDMNADMATRKGRGTGSAADRELISRFMEMLSAEKGAADNTRQSYARDLDDFTAFVAARGGKALAAVEPGDISA